MLFWLIVILAAVSFFIAYKSNKYGDTRWVFATIGTLLTVVVVFMLVAMIVSYTGIDGYIEENQEQYRILTYQVENKMYNNDNEYGKKELMDEVREYNAWLASHKEYQDDFWIGIFYPNIFDQFELIDYSNMN